MIARLVLVAVAAFAMFLAPLVGAPTQAADAAGPRCPVPQRLAMEPIAAGITPVVLVHGWTGNPQSLHTLGGRLTQQHGEAIAVRYFDYWFDSVRWAAEPHIASCLAEYLHRAADQAGVPAVVVTHSMGGLAVRFAGSPEHAVRPITAEQVSELVTIATPHRGSPWGGQIVSTVLELKEILKSHGAMPPAGLADRCLALHDGGMGLEEECDAPPYLPAGINLLQIEGGNTLDRDLLGITLYSIDQRGDGIVLSDSAGLYAGSAGQPTPTGYRLSNATVSCDARASERLPLLREALEGADNQILVAWVRSMTDNLTMDSILAGRLDEWSGPQWLATSMISDCGHSPLMDHPETAQHASTSIERALTSRPRPDLSSALVPAYCDQDERMVVDGHLDHGGGDGETWLALDNTHSWLPQTGTRVRVVEMGCTAGGVGWPGALLFYDDQGHRVGEVFTSDFDESAWRGSVEVIEEQPGDGTLQVSWFVDLGGGENRSGTGILAWVDGSVSIVSSAPTEAVLDSGGIGPARFGMSLDAAADILAPLFGPPDETPAGPRRDYAWGGVRISSLREGSTTFENWSASGEDLPPGAVFFGGVGPGSPSSEAMALFPDAEVIGGPCGPMLFGDGITYCFYGPGDGTGTVSFVQGGTPFVGE